MTVMWINMYKHVIACNSLYCPSLELKLNQKEMSFFIVPFVVKHAIVLMIIIYCPSLELQLN